MNIEELEKELKENKLNSIYLFYGDEQFLLESSVKKIKKIFGELVQGINYIQIDETNIEEIIPNMETPAFGFEKKLIIVKNTGLLVKDGKRKNVRLVEQREKLAKYLTENAEYIKDTLVIIFIEESADKNDLFKAIEKNGTICNFERQKMPQLIKRIKAICNAYKVKIDDTTAKYFIECCGTNMQDLINEIRKLIEYAGENGEITKQSIDLLSIKQIESVIFDLTDNLGKKETDKSLTILNNLIYNKEPVQKILITLYNHFKKIYITKLAIEQDRNLTEALNLKPNQMFLTSKYKIQAGYFTIQELKDIINEFIMLDRNYKKGLIDINIGLESILCRYCG